VKGVIVKITIRFEGHKSLFREPDAGIPLLGLKHGGRYITRKLLVI
jgi:hypothetical protein